MIKRFVIFVCVLLMSTTAFAGPYRPTGVGKYGATSLVGGEVGSLDALDIDGHNDPNTYNLVEGDSADVKVISGNVASVYFYIFDASGTDATDLVDYTVIRPEDFITEGVWRLATPQGTGVPTGFGTAAIRDAEDTLTDGDNLPSGAAVKAYGDSNWGGGSNAAAITFTPAGGLEATDTQAAIEELDSEKGDITSVLSDTGGAVPILYQGTTAFTDEDATPDVSTATVFRTANTGATTITNFDAGSGSLLDGQILIVLVQDANTTFDFTSSSLVGNSVDYTALNGETLMFVYSSTSSKWHYLGFPKTLSISSYTGMPILNLGGAISNPADADDMIYAYAQHATTVTDIYCVAQGSTPSITLTLQYCDDATCASPTEIEDAITCNGGQDEDDGTMTNATIPSGSWVKVLFGEPTGTVTGLTWYVKGTQTW